MGIRGLSSVIEGDCLNFSVVSLHDTIVVVSATEFVESLWGPENPTDGYGLSPLELALNFKRALINFLECEIHPVFVFTGLNDAAELCIKYVFSTRQSAGAAAALAVLLDCPLISNNSDNFIISCNPSQDSQKLCSRLKFIPISGLRLSPVELPSEAPVDSKARYFLQAHVYNPTESVLSRLTPVACRIFGVLFGDESCPRLKLPDEVDNAELSDDFGRFDWKISRDAHKLARWIEDIGPTSAVLSVASAVKDAGLKSLISRCVPDAVSRTQLDLREALQLAESLDLSIASEDPQMLSAIRKGTGVIIPCNMHYLIDLPSTYRKSQILRFLHLSFIYSYESVLMGVSTVNGAPPHIFEVDMNAPKDLSIYRISLRPLLLPTSVQNSPRNFVYGQFAFSPCPQIPEGLNDFALCLAVWHTQKQQETPHKQCLRHSECPFVLSACVCALASQFNRITAWNVTLAHYAAVVDSLEQEISPVDAGSDQYSDKEILHSVAELQDVYAELVSLLNFVKAVSLETSSEPKEFPSSFKCYPEHWVFPSNRLFFWIVKSLHQLPTESRAQTAIRSRLPRLFVPSNGPDISESCVATISDLSFLLQLLNSTNIVLPEISCTSVPANLRNMQKDSTMLLSEKQALETLANVSSSSFIEDMPRKMNEGADSVGTTSFPSFRSRCEATGGFLLTSDSADDSVGNPQWTRQSVGKVPASSCPQNDFPLPGGDTTRNADFHTFRESPSDSSLSRWSRGATTSKFAGSRNKVPNQTNGWSAGDFSGRGASYSLENTDTNGSSTNFNWESKPVGALADTDYISSDFSKASQEWIRAPQETDQSYAPDRQWKEYGPPSGSARRPAVIGGESCEVPPADDYNNWNHSSYDASEGRPSYGPPKHSAQSAGSRGYPEPLEGEGYFQRSYSQPSEYPQPGVGSGDQFDHPHLTKGSGSWDVLSAPKFDYTYGSGGENLPQSSFDRRPTSRGDSYKSDFPNELTTSYTPPVTRGRGRGGRRGSDYASRLRARVTLR
ncbi:unnamed protein product [Dibothriocephalus latus]|uniref:Asteroid domain-containing protein n=1 Tax=Dibothriocephalus latus TaxID=60516 RepID=A0A3P7LRU2_DIBLA|nr:unnamed protein product [Dibothriocephalus latus]